jgi:cell division septal protein FtsQ
VLLFLSVIVFFVAIGFFLTWISKTPSILIKKVEINGNLSVPSDEILELINKNLESPYLFIIPRKNSLLYPKEKITHSLLERYKKIENVELVLDVEKNLLVKVTERKPIGLWCSSLSSPCYYFDSTGYIFEIAPEFSDEVFIKFITVNAPENPIGHNFLPKERITEINNLINNLEPSFLPIAYTEISNDNQITFGVFNDTEDGAVDTTLIYLDGEVSLEKSLENLLSFLEQFYIDNSKSYVSKIKYIDLRYGNSVVYKLR